MKLGPVLSSTDDEQEQVFHILGWIIRAVKVLACSGDI